MRFSHDSTPHANRTSAGAASGYLYRVSKNLGPHWLSPIAIRIRPPVCDVAHTPGARKAPRSPPALRCASASGPGEAQAIGRHAARAYHAKIA
jgi:hypothetical protein